MQILEPARSAPRVRLLSRVCSALAGEGFPVLGRRNRIYNRTATEGEAGCPLLWIISSVPEPLLSLIACLALPGDEPSFLYHQGGSMTRQ